MVVRMHRVQILMRIGRPSITNVLGWMFGLNVRLVRGAWRSQRPECLWRMLCRSRLSIARRHNWHSLPLRGV